MTDKQTVLFVWLHGAGMSRTAAAYFLSAAPAGWLTLSAGVEPADTLGATAKTLLAGTSAEQFLDHAPPRPIDTVRKPRAGYCVAQSVHSVRARVDERWDLTSSAGVPLRDEIRDRAEAFARRIAAQEGEDP